MIETRILSGVFEDDLAGRLHPAGVVHARSRLALLAHDGKRVPARIEQDEHGTSARAA